MNRRAAGTAQRGSVTIEMVYVIFPFLWLVLGIIQIALIELGKIGTMRAANAAVRAAVVVLDDDPRLYGGAGRNSAPPGSARMAAIERAAAIALVPFEPPVPRPRFVVEYAIETPDPNTPLPALLTPAGKLLGQLDVSFANGGGTFGNDANVTVEVALDFTCQVPLVRAFMCDGGELRLTSQATLPNQGAPYTYQ